MYVFLGLLFLLQLRLRRWNRQTLRRSEERQLLCWLRAQFHTVYDHSCFVAVYDVYEWHSCVYSHLEVCNAFHVSRKITFHGRSHFRSRFTDNKNGHFTSYPVRDLSRNGRFDGHKITIHGKLNSILVSWLIIMVNHDSWLFRKITFQVTFHG